MTARGELEMVTMRTFVTQTFIPILALALLLPLANLAIAGEITQRELMQQLDRNAPPVIVDVRRPDEFATGHVPGARNIPHSEIAARMHELGDNRHEEVVVYCESGRRAAIAQGILEHAGFTQVRHLEGDMQSWRKRHLPQEE
jgi:rhodanese-related sulfurtransferase